MMSMECKVSDLDYSTKEKKAKGPWNGSQDMKVCVGGRVESQIINSLH